MCLHKSECANVCVCWISINLMSLFDRCATAKRQHPKKRRRRHIKADRIRFGNRSANRQKKEQYNWTQLSQHLKVSMFIFIFIVCVCVHSAFTHATWSGANCGSCFKLNWFTLIRINLHDVTIDDDGGGSGGGNKRHIHCPCQLYTEWWLLRRHKGYWHQPLFVKFYYRCFNLWVCVIFFLLQYSFSIPSTHKQIQNSLIRSTELTELISDDCPVCRF